MGLGSAGQAYEALPDGGVAARFLVVEADSTSGRTGLYHHSDLNNYDWFLAMISTQMACKHANTGPFLPSEWSLSHFEVVDGGDGTIALYHPGETRFVKMTGATTAPKLHWSCGRSI